MVRSRRLRSAFVVASVAMTALAGGCAMNSVANGKIRDNTPFTVKTVNGKPAQTVDGSPMRSEEHTSELQSH